jgi:hypothetical protein
MEADTAVRWVLQNSVIIAAYVGRFEGVTACGAELLMQEAVMAALKAFRRSNGSIPG